MSYILEALKKSEQERKKEGVPDILAEHSVPLPRRPVRNSRPRWVAGGLLLFLLSGGGWLWWQGQKGEPSPSTAEQELPLPVPVILPPPASVPLSHEVRSQSVEKTDMAGRETGKLNTLPPPSLPSIERAVTAKVPARPTPVVAQEKQAPVIPLLTELPTKMQNRIPELSFAGHVFGAAPGKRLIVINNRIVREGDLISDGLALVRITRNGVVLRYELVVFRVELF